jgi:hypothetical protein
MSNNTTPPPGAHQQPPDDMGIRAVLGSACGVEATGGTSTQPEFVSTHSSSVCKQVYVDSGNDKTMLYVLSIGLDHDNVLLFSLEQEPFQRTHSARPRTPIL